MPGTTLRLDDVDHKMLQILSLKTGRTQNQLILSLLHEEFARHGITREQTGAMMKDPNRLWTALGRQPPVIPTEVHTQVLADLAALDAGSGTDQHQAAA